MRLPAPLSRRNLNVHKHTFGHVLILAGSERMLGAAALATLAALRSGAGLVSLGIPKSLNLIAQRKITNAVMTLPLAETNHKTISLSAFSEIKKTYGHYTAIVLGPGMGTHPSTQKFILKIISTSPIPLVIDASALNALADGNNLKRITKTQTIKILTPHPGEMAGLTKLPKSFINNNRSKVANDLAKKCGCVVVLKGHHTVIASPEGKIYINKTGNPGMATAGSGDVLSGMIGAFLAQGLSAFDAAKWGTYLHGKAGDFAAKDKTRLAMIASDIVDNIPLSIKTML